MNSESGWRSKIMGDILVKTRVLEQGRSMDGDDDYDLVDYTFSGYVKAIDAINTVCEDKHKTFTLSWAAYDDIGLSEPVLYFFKRNEEGEFICKNDDINKSARELLEMLRCNWVVAKKMQEHVWITVKDWKVVGVDLATQ